MLCENCHKNEATCHICVVVGDVSESRDLCLECHEASSPEARALSESQRNAHCCYCGGQPCAGGTDFLAMIAGIPKLKFMCLPCSMEHNRYRREQLQAQQNVAELSQQEQLAWLRKLDQQAEAYMKQWVSDRNSR